MTTRSLLLVAARTCYELFSDFPTRFSECTVATARPAFRTLRNSFPSRLRASRALLLILPLVSTAAGSSGKLWSLFDPELR